MARKREPKDYLRAVDEDDNRIEVGHNRKKDLSDSVVAEQLRGIIQRIERIEKDIAALQADRKEIYAEAKGNGFDPKTIRRIIALRKVDHSEREEAEALFHTYLRALGMQMTLNLEGEEQGAA